MNDLPNTVDQDIEALEDAYDALAAKLVRIESANEERVPLSLVERLSDCEVPVVVWREYRGLTDEALAMKAKLPVETVRAAERDETVALRDLAAIARALKVDLDDLVRWTEAGASG